VVAISHDVDFCADHFERVVVMAGGRLLADGPAGAVLGQADLLARADVQPPQLVRLAARLGLAAVPLTAGDFIAALRGRPEKSNGHHPE
jgi:energy-coupling factor transport system ATP-binding protein